MHPFIIFRENAALTEYLFITIAFRLNPDYSEDHNNKYAFHCYATDLVEVGGLVFKAKDWDRVGSNDDLVSNAAFLFYLFDALSCASS